VSQALDGDGLAGERAHPEMGERGLHAADDAASGRRGGIAAAADRGWNAGHETAGGEDGRDVLRHRADVLGGDVAAAETGDERAVLLEDPAPGGGILRPAGRAGDDPLASPPPDAGESVLVGHAARQAQAVAQKSLHRVVAPETQPSGALPAAGAVDERRLEHAGLGSDLEEDRLVPIEVATVSCEESGERLDH